MQRGCHSSLGCRERHLWRAISLQESRDPPSVRQYQEATALQLLLCHPPAAGTILLPALRDWWPMKCVHRPHCQSLPIHDPIAHEMRRTSRSAWRLAETAAQRSYISACALGVGSSIVEKRATM